HVCLFAAGRPAIGMSAVEGLRVELSQERPIPLAAQFSCAPGEVLALVGPSGSGKSTILRAIAGTYRPQLGKIEVNGEAWFSAAAGRFVPAHQRAVGMVFQTYALFRSEERRVGKEGRLRWWAEY